MADTALKEPNREAPSALGATGAQPTTIGGAPAPAIQPEQALAVTDFGDDAGAGMEGTRLEEQTTPFLRMAQGLSPELNPGKGEYIRGLALGMLFNTATREVYPGVPGVEAVVCGKDYHYGLWVPRDLGGGFRGAVPPEDPIVRSTIARMTEKYGSSARFKLPRYKDGRWTDDPARTRDTDEPVELVETGQLYVLYAPDKITADNAQRAIIACTSTALPAYSRYITRHMNALWPQRNGGRKPAPIFAYRWRFTTFQDKNNRGEFYNWKIDLSPPGATFLEALYAREDPELFAMAREFFSLVRAGAVKPDESASAAAVDDPEHVPF